MHISEFDYELPEDLIAQHPLAERDASRMLIVNRAEGSLQDEHFSSLPRFLRAGDCLVLNNTKVFPARLLGKRLPTGGAVELLLLREVGSGVWQTLARPARRLQLGTRIGFGGKLKATVTGVNEDGTREIEFDRRDGFWHVIEEIGEPPLPPYIKRDDVPAREDRERYQTIYAQQTGAIAAPTAGLHFTPKVFDELAQAGIRIAEITLHVGYGTFEPVRVDDISQHRVQPEAFSINAEAANAVNGARAVCHGIGQRLGVPVGGVIKNEQSRCVGHSGPRLPHHGAPLNRPSSSAHKSSRFNDMTRADKRGAAPELRPRMPQGELNEVALDRRGCP